MVDFVATMAVVTSFVANVLALPFMVFGTFANFVMFCLSLSLIGFIIHAIYGDDP